MTSVPSPACVSKWFCMISTSSIVNSCAPSAELILMSIHFAPLISLSLSNGEFNASSIALRARSSPATDALPRMATPPFFITVHTSAKSTLICPVLLITSVMHFAAVAKTLSAFANASRIFRFPNWCRSLSLLITSKVST